MRGLQLVDSWSSRPGEPFAGLPKCFEGAGQKLKNTGAIKNNSNGLYINKYDRHFEIINERATGQAGEQTGDHAESEGVGAAHLVPAPGRGSLIISTRFTLFIFFLRKAQVCVRAHVCEYCNCGCTRCGACHCL
jgi:hypothetical protein